MKFANYFKIYDCIKDTLLYREGDAADKVYVVMQGEFEILKKIQVKKKDNILETDIKQILKDPLGNRVTDNKYIANNSQFKS